MKAGEWLVLGGRGEKKASCDFSAMPSTLEGSSLRKGRFKRLLLLLSTQDVTKGSVWGKRCSTGATLPTPGQQQAGRLGGRRAQR